MATTTLGARVALLCIALGAFMAAVSVAAETSAQPVSDGRFAQLERGINLSHYAGDFGLVSGQPGSRVIDASVLSGLGLDRQAGK